MKQDYIETIIGFIVIAITIFFLSFAFKTGHQSKNGNSYSLNATFQNAEGIVPGSDIMLAGIKVGSVEKLTLDKNSFSAILTMRINNDIKLPQDTSAGVTTSGFLGSKFIALNPGAADEELKNGDQIKYTQSSINIEALLGKFMYSFGK